ncbi:hypothetical protein [Pajaroellobacter abortibovis]|uniref:Uncharacterized protein n=1 Tax=Pajaroellobacter abortibovis TaxID=1882918 RepID=A0A1L6MYA0_9BACT|nr:hypothetical protein [Pajaroellobacter abortibovis]APS00500.1 hypothetical protein BCY86_07280 [Pajaroellobacter abortibovis]
MEKPNSLPPLAWDTLEHLLNELEELQSQKVIDLARRIRPGLTLEDIKNPHDFPELSEPDWHYEDGILTGIQSVISAIRSLKHQLRSKGNPSSNPSAASSI